MVPIVIKLGETWRCVASFTHGLLYPGQVAPLPTEYDPAWVIDQSGRFKEKKNRVLLLGIEPRLLGVPVSPTQYSGLCFPAMVGDILCGVLWSSAVPSTVAGRWAPHSCRNKLPPASEWSCALILRIWNAVTTYNNARLYPMRTQNYNWRIYITEN
jgi:hypothetical protein